MKILNRGYIKVSPTEVFWQWAFQQNEDIQELIDFSEPSIYLIDEDFWDDDLILTKFMKKISDFEFLQISESDDVWPEIETVSSFRIYFNIEIGNTVFDCLKTPIESTMA